MSARLLVPPDATYEEWLARRAELSRNAVTASEIAVILGISPYDSAFNLYWKKTGVLSDDFDNTAMSLGRHLEPWIADRWMEEHPEFLPLMGGLWANEARPWQMCTPDRLLLESAGEPEPVPPGPDEAVSLLEIKSSGTYEEWGEDGTDEIPAYYRAQVLWQLDTLGLTEAHVCCLFLSTRQIRNYTISYDAADIDLMRMAAVKFLDNLAASEPPDIDAHHATTEALRQLHPDVVDETADVGDVFAVDYRFACENLARAKERKAIAENYVRQAMGNARTAEHDGQKVATRSVYDMAGLDRDRLRREFPDAWEACKTTTTVDKLIAARPKKESA